MISSDMSLLNLSFMFLNNRYMKYLKFKIPKYVTFKFVNKPNTVVSHCEKHKIIIIKLHIRLLESRQKESLPNKRKLVT